MADTSRREFLSSFGKWSLLGLGAAPLSVFMAGCAQMGKVTRLGTGLGVMTGVIGEKTADKLTDKAERVAYNFQDLTPEQGYYIGRALGATILKNYKPYDNPEANKYINLVGSVVARASDMPETFGGYHFLILDTLEATAFAAPEGLIFISRGMLRICEHEDSVAAVLGHEIGHVQAKHGLQAIKASRITTTVTGMAITGAKSLGIKKLKEVTQQFEGAITDITSAMVNNGYSRAAENEADEGAIRMVEKVAYNPFGLVEVLSKMERRPKGKNDFLTRTHPGIEARIQNVKDHIYGHDEKVARPPKRQARFEEFKKRI